MHKTIYLTDEEFNVLENEAKKQNLTVSGYIKKKIFEKNSNEDIKAQLVELKNILLLVNEVDKTCFEYLVSEVSLGFDSLSHYVKDLQSNNEQTYTEPPYSSYFRDENYAKAISAVIKKLSEKAVDRIRINSKSGDAK